MSLQYIIDGYNITNHTTFTQHINKKVKDQRVALLELIQRARLAGSPKNLVIVVFDGFPKAQDTFQLNNEDFAIRVIFSREESADKRIEKLIEQSGNPKNIIVVSDDKEIVFFAKALGAKAKSVEDFLLPPKRAQEAKGNLLEAELSYSQMHRINEELRRLWLKG